MSSAPSPAVTPPTNTTTPPVSPPVPPTTTPTTPPVSPPVPPPTNPTTPPVSPPVPPPTNPTTPPVPPPTNPTTPPVSPPPPVAPPPTPVIPPSPPLTPSPPPPSPITPPTPLTPSPPPPSPATPPTPLTPSPLPPSPVTPPTPLTPSPPPPSPATPPTPLTPSPRPPSPVTPPTPLTPSPPPPSPTTPSTPLKPLSPPPPPSPTTPSTPLKPLSPPPQSPTAPSTPLPPSTLAPPPPSSSGLSTGVAVGIGLGGVVVLIMALTFIICFLFKKKRRRDHEAPPTPIAGVPSGEHQQQNASRESNNVPPPPRPPTFTSSSSGGGYDSNYSDNSFLPPVPSPGLVLSNSNYQGTFTYEEISKATNGFSESNWLGQGGFGYVYRGRLSDGKDIAVKQLKAESAQGEREFQAEVKIISRIHHRHLVALVGYCIADAQRLLVYEFVPNNTLEFHIHGKGRPPLEWSSRFKIAIGSAKGISYLHENCTPKIIHRDIKAANILLDFKFEAKVADFGLAKIALDTNTHVSTRVMGTFGYLAPEYAASGKLTEKSDVFSFGVVLLELITGRRPVDTNTVDAHTSLVDWARPLLTRALEENNFEGIIDTKMNDEYDREEMARMVACAAACVRSTASRRPRMDQVTRVLEGNISASDLNQGITPGHSNVYSSSYGGSSTTDNEMIQGNETMSTKYSSSEFSNPTTTEYDLYSIGWSTDGQTTRDWKDAKRTGRRH